MSVKWKTKRFGKFEVVRRTSHGYWARVPSISSQYLGMGETIKAAIADAEDSLKKMKKK